MYLTGLLIPGLGQFKWVLGHMGLLACSALFLQLVELAMAGLVNIIEHIDDLLVH